MRSLIPTLFGFMLGPDQKLDPPWQPPPHPFGDPMSLTDRLRAAVIKLASPAKKPEPAPATLRPDIAEALLNSLKAAGIVPPNTQVRVHSIPLDRHSATQPGIEPPHDPQAEGMTWTVWQSCMTEMAPPEGWSPCRFGNRTGEQDMQFVFGIAKGPLGIWRGPCRVCDHETDDHETRILFLMTHLTSGFGIGVFADKATAIEAADLALTLPWGDPAILGEAPAARAAYRAHCKRMADLWEFNGIDWDEDCHCHFGENEDMTGPMGIWTKSEKALIAGKPEKLA